MIGGAFRMTSIPAMDVETYLLPIALTLEKQLTSAYLRIASSPMMAELKEVRNFRPAEVLRTPRTRGRPRAPVRIRASASPLEVLHSHIEGKLRISLDQLEKQVPYAVPPWWEPPIIHIASDKETAEREHHQIVARPRPPIAIYTDGSGINNRIGSAAVSPRKTIWEVFRLDTAYLGPDSVATVYTGELYGTLMALRIANTYPGAKRVVVFTDNQASLLAIQNPKNQSGQSILIQIVTLINALRAEGIAMEFRWIPAHIGVEGNEEADKRAKEATGWSGKGVIPPPPLIQTINTIFAAAVRASAHKAIMKDWGRRWAAETRGRSTYKLTPIPTSKILSLHDKVGKPISSMIIQLRTEKIGLRKFLYSRGVPGIEDEGCGCGLGQQTVMHVLLMCPRFDQLRREVWGGVVPRGGNLKMIRE